MGALPGADGPSVVGLSAGAELGGVSVYLAEIATPGRKGFYTSWQSGSQQVAIMVAAAIGFALNALLDDAALRAWGGVFRSCWAA